MVPLQIKFYKYTDAKLFLFLPPEIIEIQYLCLCGTFCHRICHCLGHCWGCLGRCWHHHRRHCCCCHFHHLRSHHNCRFCCRYQCCSLVDCCLPPPLPLFPPAAAIACPHRCCCCLPAPLPLLPPPQPPPLFLPPPTATIFAATIAVSTASITAVLWLIVVCPRRLPLSPSPQPLPLLLPPPTPPLLRCLYLSTIAAFIFVAAVRHCFCFHCRRTTTSVFNIIATVVSATAAITDKKHLPAGPLATAEHNGSIHHGQVG